MDYSSDYVDFTSDRNNELQEDQNWISAVKESASNYIKQFTEHLLRAEQNEGVNDTRVIMLGQTGSGKSATGNSILGSGEFASQLAPKSITKMSQKAVKFRFGRNITVIDTPGIDNTELTENEIALEIAKCVMMSTPGPHCFLLTIPIGDIAVSFKRVILFLTRLFGAELFYRTIAVFTYADKLQSNNISIEDYFRGDQDLSIIIQRCNRYVVIDNTKNDMSQIQNLFDKMDEIILNHNEGYYKNECFRVPAVAMEERERRKAQREEITAMKIIKKITDPLSSEIAKLNTTVEMLRQENEAFKGKIKQLENSQKDTNAQAQHTKRDLDKSTRRQREAISKLAVDQSALVDLVSHDFHAIHPRQNRPHPYRSNNGT